MGCLGDVSIHAPREGCDEGGDVVDVRSGKFQFTHPGRGATTRELNEIRQGTKFQFTHPGRGATGAQAKGFVIKAVSIHAPREGCDGEATRAPPIKNVSIHAPREGCD